MLRTSVFFVGMFLSGAIANAQSGRTPISTVPRTSVNLPQEPRNNPSVSNAQKEHLIEVYRLKPFCFSRTEDSFVIDESRPTGGQTPAAERSCTDGQASFPAQNAADIEKAFVSESDFHVQAAGPDTIVIYQKAQAGSTPVDRGNVAVRNIEANADTLAKPPFRYARTISVPKGAAARIAAQINATSVAGLSAEVVGNSRILVKNDGTPALFSSNFVENLVNDLVWDRASAPPTQRLFHLDADSVAKRLSSGGDNGGAKPDHETAGPGAQKNGGDSSTPSVAVTVTNNGSSQDVKNSTDPAASDGVGVSNSDSQSKPQKKPETTNKPNTTDDAKKPPNSVVAKPVTMQSVGDTIIFSNSDGSDDRISDNIRLMAMLDLPRPEVLLNMWSLQVSSPYADAVKTNSELVRETVAHHNEALQRAIEDGWDYLSKESKKTGFFDTKFYNYVTQKFTVASERSLPASVAFMKAHANGLDANRERWGWCDSRTYCLGFSHAFEPLRPTFTNILLTIAASTDPPKTAEQTIRYMTGECPPDNPVEVANTCPQTPLPAPTHAAKSRKVYLRCITAEQKFVELLAARAKPEDKIVDCELRDRMRLVGQAAGQIPETLQLQCFAEQARRSFATGEATHQATRVGLLRAAIADFLFNYKMTQQFPHDFVPYDLSQSAQELNAEFNPLVLAFNRDVAALMQHLQSELACRKDESQSGHWFGDERGTFLNDGMIAVRGISGVESIVDTITQSYFDATKPPNLTDLVKSVSDAEKDIPTVLKANLTSHEAAVLVGALNSVQPAQAKIGRQFRLDITPHALASASSAELDVQLTNQETSDPTLFKAGKTSEDDLSRVGRHNTTTKVRVESLKLFEVSSFSAMLQRPRTRFPILPPFFEVPYFGSFLGIPLPGAKEYHRSTAVVSAVIVPTAADLAYGIDFTGDRVCEIASDPTYGVADSHGNRYRCYRAKSFSDLRGLPFRNYHKAMVQCFASGGSTGHTGRLSPDASLMRRLRAPEFENEVQQSSTQEAEGKPCEFTFQEVPPAE